MSQTPVPITGGTGTSSIAAELVGGTSWQQVEVYGQGGASVLAINPDGSFKASIIGTPTVTITGNPSISGTVIVTGLQGASISGTVGASIIGTVPVTGTLNSSFTQPSSFVSGVTSVMTGTSSVQVLVPAPAAQRNYITNVLVTNAAAVGTTVQLFDAGNVIYSGFAAASGGGFSLSFPTALKQSSIAGNLSALSTVQASVFVSASGYTAA